MGIFPKFRIYGKRAFDRIRNEKVKQNLLQAVPFWVASALSGLTAVLYAKLFVLAEKGTTYILQTHAWLLFIMSPLCFVFAWWIVTRWAPYSRGSGIPQIMAALELATPKFNIKVKKLLNLRIIVVKFASSLIMALGGGIIGREGPTIQISACIFRKINEWLPSWWPKISKKNMIMTGAAAGLAAAFNTPLGGIVFAVEELTRTHISSFKTALFTAIIVAGLTAQALLGPYLYLGFPDVGHLSSFILPCIALVALVAGLAASLMSRGILLIFRWKDKFRFTHQHVLYAAACGVVVIAMAYFITPDALGSGKDLMTNLLFTSDKYHSWYLPILRIVGMSFSFTSGAAGGIFAPALSAGATVGATLSDWMHLSAADTNILILSGMTAFLTGVTRTPFTSAILVLEMTDRHNVIFHLMLAGMVAGLVSMIVDKHSLYDHLKYRYLHAVLEDKEVTPGYQEAAVAPN
ncbi:MAG: chloride channel protein [Bacteroidetes bacterium]|nr:chloride channel protein [Bacteroidota bacterium]